MKTPLKISAKREKTILPSIRLPTSSSSNNLKFIILHQQSQKSIWISQKSFFYININYFNSPSRNKKHSSPSIHLHRNKILKQTMEFSEQPEKPNNTVTVSVKEKPKPK